MAAAAGLTLAAPCTAGSCLLNEAFNGASGFTWGAWNTYGYITPVVGNGQVQMTAYYPNLAGAYAAAGVETSNWALDLEDDFAFTIDWSNNAQNTVSGYMRVHCVLKTYGAGMSEFPSNGVALSLVRGGGSSIHEWWAFSNNTVTYNQQTLSSTTNRTSQFVYYASSDSLHMISGGVTRTVTGLRSTAGRYIEIALTAGSFYIPSQSANAVTISDLCFSDGTFTGPLTGACCTGEACVQGFASNCSGVFKGTGTTCEYLGTCYDTNCPGDFTMDGSINSNDVIELFDHWSATCEPCSGTGTATGVAGVRDLMNILANWGTCG